MMKTKKVMLPKYGVKYKYIGDMPMYSANSIFEINKIYAKRCATPFENNNKIRSYFSSRQNVKFEITLKNDVIHERWDMECFVENFEEIIEDNNTQLYNINISKEELEILNKAKEIIERINNNIIR